MSCGPGRSSGTPTWRTWRGRWALSSSMTQSLASPQLGIGGGSDAWGRFEASYSHFSRHVPYQERFRKDKQWGKGRNDPKPVGMPPWLRPFGPSPIWEGGSNPPHQVTTSSSKLNIFFFRDSFILVNHRKGQGWLRPLSKHLVNIGKPTASARELQHCETGDTEEVVVWVSKDEGYSAWVPSSILIHLNPDGVEQPYQDYQQLTCPALTV